jgi:hypothetical protein
MGKEIVPLSKIKQATTNAPRPTPVRTPSESTGYGEKHPVDSLIAITISVILFIGAIGVTVYSADFVRNPPESWCQDLNNTSTAFQLVYVENGMCIKTETGFHANGKGIFK